METIKTLHQLKHNLNLGPGYGGYSSLISAVEFSEDELRHMVQFDRDEYQRVCLYDTIMLEAVLTCWEPGQQGTIHNFNHSVGWFKVLQGSTLLEHFMISPEGKVHRKADLAEELKAPEVGYLSDDIGFHRFSNPGKERALVLVMYSDKIEHWQEYDEKTEKVSKVKVRVHRHLDTSA